MAVWTVILARNVGETEEQLLCESIEFVATAPTLNQACTLAENSNPGYHAVRVAAGLISTLPAPLKQSRLF